ncbi:HpsJ family protein [Synechococcus sp. Cruz-9H2]|uniref:HpsJ family protein n=1 Tax=unclassified Synechococcus TaxID=2626047 RepID=UPI0020CBD97D|nr:MULTISPECIES: HpsJ family protein [unclassified Synechococcus]MCP9817874.1 HpsJ family protein [Synechococcus sp. Cruz-9H2]MCP9842626.1 HpsJ family protein [Synechococcus sp. Edmonson 11F2]MCP9854270.1 HpsJ family protein [Synechococcus sp. Cruz-9C9]MCP9862034.1 HpsJ family protein [Synechococcus sp. Cruz-7E5]MCP9868782.1 HpsJ family protein [Synechococcus sp. Cruz-7B9]
MTIELQDDFSHRRVRSLGRLCAYTLVLVFIASTLTALVPLPFADAQRTLAFLNELLERSSLPAVAVLFLFFGLSGDALPALWECQLARWLRPLLRLVALLYLITAVAIFGVGQQLSRTGVAALDGQVRTSLDNLRQFRQQVDGEISVERLRGLVARQPQILQALQQEGTLLDRNSPLPELRQQVDRLLARVETNVRRQSQTARSNAAGQLARQMARLSVMALIYAFYYLGAFLIWPRSLLATVERVRQARQARWAAEVELQDE